MKEILLAFINYLRYREELKYAKQTKEKDSPAIVIINNIGGKESK